MPSITNNLPITLLAQLDDVAVFQTAAFTSDDNDGASAVNLKDYRPTDEKIQTSYGSLNLGLHVNDNAKKVLDNRMRLLTSN